MRLALATRGRSRAAGNSDSCTRWAIVGSSSSPLARACGTTSASAHAPTIVLMGTRKPAHIVARRTWTPAFARRHRPAGIMSDLGLSDYVFDISVDPEAFVSRLRKALANSAAFQQTPAATMPRAEQAPRP